MPDALIHAKQIPFDLGARQAFGRDDFHVGGSNRDAVGWIDSWPSWPAPVLVLQGSPASGKSHLAAVWKEQSNAEMIKPAMLLQESADDLCACGDALVLDGLDPWLGSREAETKLFHMYNLLKEEQKTMLITMRMAPNQVDFILPDLASRFRAAPTVGIHPPDDDLLRSVLQKLFADRQLLVGENVLTYLLPRMERSFAAARDIVMRADRLALAEHRDISTSLMRRVLAEMMDD